MKNVALWLIERYENYGIGDCASADTSVFDTLGVPLSVRPRILVSFKFSSFIWYDIYRGRHLIYQAILKKEGNKVRNFSSIGFNHGQGT